MAQQKSFGLKIPGASSHTAGDQLKQLDIQKDYNFKIVSYEDIEPNPLNDYPMVEIEALAESIKKYGLLQNIGLIPNSEGSKYKYRLYNGERRYRAIGLLLQQGDTTFLKGIPSKIESSNIDLIDEEIKLILANNQRELTPEFKRKKAARLTELYQLKSTDPTVGKIDVTKKIAENLNLGERQVQRYNAINNKLIPALQAEFDKSNISIEKAAQFASFDESTQSLILELLKNNDTITKEKIEFLQQKQEKLETEYKKNIEQKNEEIQTLKMNNNFLQEEIQESESKLSKTNEDLSSIRQEIKEELEKSFPSQEKIDSLTSSLETLSNEQKKIELEKRQLEKNLTEKEKKIKNLEQELKQKTEQIEKPTIGLTEEEKKKLSDSYELNCLINDAKKKLSQILVKSNDYYKHYNMLPEDLSTLKSFINNKLLPNLE